MEKIFYVAPATSARTGIFGNMHTCACFIARAEGHTDDDIDAEDPLESLTTLLNDSPSKKYELVDASLAISLQLTIEEAMKLKSLPEGIKVGDIPDWLEVVDDKPALREMVDVMHERNVSVRLRGHHQTVAQSPFTPAVYEALLQQLS